MEIKEITLQDYAKLIDDNHIAVTFPQSAEYIGMKGMIPVGGFVDGKLVAAIAVRFVTVRKIFKYAWSGREWILTDPAYEDGFIRSMAAWLKKQGCILWEVESGVEVREYDLLGAPKEDGYNNADYEKRMEEHGFVFRHLPAGYHTEHQALWVCLIDLKEKGNNYPMAIKDLPVREWPDLIEDMKPNTRRAVKQYERRGVIVKKFHGNEMTDELWDQVMSLIEQGARKHDYDAGSQESFKNLVDAFGDHGYAAIAYIKDEETGDLIPVSAGIYFETNYEMYYFSSGSDPKYRKFNGASAIQAEMMKTALEHGLDRYNFLGISGIFDKENETYGIFEFKKHLGGRPVEYFGPMDMVLSPMGSLLLKRMA